MGHGSRVMGSWVNDPSWVHDCDPFGEYREGGYNNLGVKWVMGQWVKRVHRVNDPLLGA